MIFSTTFMNGVAMRRLAILGGTVALLGCASVKDLFTAHANEAAQAGSFTLSVERLATILGAAQGAQIDVNAARYAANLWIDYALFAQAVVKDLPLRDSATVLAAFWPEVGQYKTGRWHDVLMAQRAAPDSGAVDALYDQGDVRVLQHILIGLKPGFTDADKAGARRKADETLGRVRGGADFARLASQLSQDPGSARNGGLLPPASRGTFVPAFDSAGWALAPGAISGVVETAFGFHIIRRPTLAEVRPAMAEYAGRSRMAQLDSLYLREVQDANKLEVKASAPADVRAVLAPEGDDVRATKALASGTRGFVLTTGDLARWLRALPPQLPQQLATGPDSALRDFVKSLATQQLILRAADSAGIAIEAADYAGLLERYGEELDSLAIDLGLTAGAAADRGAPGAERLKAAEAAYEAWFDRLITGQAPLRALPSQLGSVLRGTMAARVSAAGLKKAVELVQVKQPAPDTSAFKAAPGGPPVGGDAPAGGGAPGRP